MRPEPPPVGLGHMAWFGLGGWGVGRGRDEEQPVRTSVAGFGDDMRTFIDTAQISVFGVDRDRRVNVWNSRVEELMGRPASDVMGKSLVDVVSEGNQTPAETRNEVWCLTSLATLCTLCCPVAPVHPRSSSCCTYAAASSSTRSSTLSLGALGVRVKGFTHPLAGRLVALVCVSRTLTWWFLGQVIHLFEEAFAGRRSPSVKVSYLSESMVSVDAQALVVEVLITASPLKDADGLVHGVLGFAQDISESRCVDVDLERARVTQVLPATESLP